MFSCFLHNSIGYFTPQGTKSPNSYHAIIPVYNNIFPEIIAINKKKKREEKSHLKSSTFSCLVLYMDEKYMIDCNKLGSGIRKNKTLTKICSQCTIQKLMEWLWNNQTPPGLLICLLIMSLAQKFSSKFYICP